MVCWVSIIVFCAAVLRVAENLPLEEDDISALKYPSNENAFSDEEKELGDALSRDKRTIGILRQIFPGLSQIVDRKIQMLTRLAFRLIGRLVLRGGAGGGGGTGTASSGESGRKVSITLPTYPPSVDDDEDEDEDSSDSTTTGSEAASTTEDDSTTTTEASESENQVAESKVSEVKVRVTRDTEKVNNNADQQPAATGDNDNDNDLDSSDNDGEGSEDSPRNKRLLNFNLGGGGSGGGSGNFLFDIIRLVAGSGTTQEKDEAENAPLEEGSVAASDPGLTGKDDGYSAGVPGPLTRLFVIANRGIANLIQDLILRLAQTSERIVNFKARLITSII